MQHLSKLFRTFAQTLISGFVKVEPNPHHTDLTPIRAHPRCVYVIEYQSTVDAWVVDRELQRLGLDSAFNTIQLSYALPIQSLATLKARSSISSQKTHGIAPRLQQLLDALAQSPEEDVWLVPVALYWGRAAQKPNSVIKAAFSSNWGVIGRFKKLFTVLFNGRRAYMEINKPISLKTLLDTEHDTQRAARKVARVLRVHFRNVRTAVIGPDFSHKSVLVEQVLASEPVRKAIRQHSETKGISEEKANRLAQKHVQTIAADISHTTVRILDVLLTKLWNKIYNGVSIHGIEPVRELAKDNAIVYVPCHRSHIDYLLLSYSLYYHGLTMPHIAAGENLNIPIVGGILRRGGAFFIRRRFGSDKLYSTVFNEYIHCVFTRGYPVEYFVEGGRSRTGRMRTPATGTLAMTVKSHLRDHKRPIVFIPVYIGYEKVFESRAYLSELKGKEKKQENLFDLVKTVRQLKNYGRVHLNFGQPIHLNQRLDENVENWQDTSMTPSEKPAWMPPFVDQLANDVVSQINAAAALNPINLVATVLLSTPRQAIEAELLHRQLDLLSCLAQSSPYSKFMTQAEGTAETWIDYAVQFGALSVIPQQLGTLYGLDSRNTIALAYYRNNVLHLFALPSLIAAILVQAKTIQRHELHSIIGAIYPYLKSELFLSLSSESVIEQTNAILENLKSVSQVTIEADTITAPSREQTKSIQLRYLANVILPTLERYLLTLSILVRSGSGVMSQKALETEAQQMAERLSLLNGIDAPEFFDKALFKNFVQTLKSRGGIEVNEAGNLTFDDRVPSIVRQSSKVIPQDVWFSINLVIQSPKPPSESPC